MPAAPAGQRIGSSSPATTVTAESPGSTNRGDGDGMPAAPGGRRIGSSSPSVTGTAESPGSTGHGDGDAMPAAPGGQRIGSKQHRAASPRPADPARAFRQVTTLAAVSTIVPGLAHMLVGREQIGRLILRVYICVLAVAAVLLVLGLFSKRILLELAVRPGPLQLLEYASIIVAICWCLVIVNGAFLGRPARLDPARQRMAAVVVLALCVAVALPLLLTARYAEAQRGLITSVFADTGGASELPERLNVLLLGGDAGDGRIGTRTDSVNLASIDTKTGNAVVFSLPRNLQNVPFPSGSPMERPFPNGFDCGDECLLNAVYTYATSHPELFPGVRDPGAEAVKQAVSATLGVPVHYYVLVNLEGFQQIVDALGGVTIRIDRRVPIGGIAPDGTRVPVTGYIEPGLQELDGYEALWYSRSRTDSDDYARMARQRCVMGAILHEADPWSVLRNYQKLANSAKHLFSTDIPRNLLPDLVGVALAAKDAKITNLQFVPPLIVTADPDFGLLRGKVAQAIRDSEHPPTTSGPSSEQSSTPSVPEVRPADSTSPGGGGDSASATQPVDLGSVCHYS